MNLLDFFAETILSPLHLYVCLEFLSANAFAASATPPNRLWEQIRDFSAESLPM